LTFFILADFIVLMCIVAICQGLLNEYMDMDMVYGSKQTEYYSVRSIK